MTATQQIAPVQGVVWRRCVRTLGMKVFNPEIALLAQANLEVDFAICTKTLLVSVEGSLHLQITRWAVPKLIPIGVGIACRIR